jgi:hypothetical protein
MAIDFFCIRLTCLGLPKIRKSSSIEKKIRTRYIFRYAFKTQLGSGQGNWLASLTGGEGSSNY